jgi:hypothetical protein
VRQLLQNFDFSEEHDCAVFVLKHVLYVLDGHHLGRGLVGDFGDDAERPLAKDFDELEVGAKLKPKV